MTRLDSRRETAPRRDRLAAGTRRRRVDSIVITGMMALCALYFLTPLWWLITASSKSRGALSTTPGLWFGGDFDLFKNLGDLFTIRGSVFGRWLLNSLLYAGIGALLATLIAAMMGYALAKYGFRGRETLFNTILAGVLIPGTALALPLFLMFSSVNLTNTIWAVLLPSLVSPLGVYLARIYAASSVPDELLEAARLDGAGEFRMFFTVSLRLMTPALVTIFLFQFSQIWNNFFLPLVMLQDDSLFPVTMGLYSWNTQIAYAPELRLYVIVGALVAVVPVIVAFLSLQRFWQTGLAEGSVK
ncbi:carbohydrate ABC transporter permease [Herbiconiux ginsengi]|uniref:Carbohydrate ABC transporter membrane protein 2, CUT1 family n=1 Tax=Herbiconiux ginsengi TaxID=381665 RepID=A0A1H3U321_9MICO|nr:carbohydrate ABC transporter permease [Herbiconiux ginsengi]SDZ56752.1 carbohydrate ABC transporter membrane protein 2, CUT1 family [Herbiconiux ginsengi]